MSNILHEYNSDATSSDDAENAEELFFQKSSFKLQTTFDSRAESKSKVLAQKLSNIFMTNTSNNLMDGTKAEHVVFQARAITWKQSTMF